MKINKQTLFSIILICFALVGKSMSHDKPSTTETPSSSPTTTPSSLSTTETPSSSPTTTPSASSPTTSETTTPPASSPTTSETTTPSSSPTSSPSDQFSDTPSMDPPSDSPAPTPDGGASGYSSPSTVSISDYLKEKYGDQSKAEYNPDLEKICGHTHQPDVCLATISPLIKNKKKFDVVRILEASIKVSKENIKDIVEKIEKQAKESGENDESLNECKENYSKALDNLHKALEAIRAKNYGKVTILLSGALADVSTAESKIVDMQLSNFKVEPFSFASVTASNCLSIASLVPN
ncbi:PREDICTED: swi5-dependent recombination DNA repair protein 1 homolog isoform X2 [Lupinus angustifolius]|uniref:swi5-dependent recombination DNA repair protein 1 homolog isoform X2 n=1 Tax=Lupinus angustifolius TaxID=3871 RepID=UPI00092F7F33|nr:PREDICTED: swi5-dependent recombination DNA repair protein 1 homolog isoform X2 [Lupinus angustifolius]